MKLDIINRSVTGKIVAGQVVKIAATIAAVMGLIIGGGTPANADEKPAAPKTPTFVGNVDSTVPHLSSDDVGQARGLGPCSYLLAGITPVGFGWSGEFRWFACSYWGEVAAYPKMKFKSLSGLVVPLYWY
jgi:hypothetical protein